MGFMAGFGPAFAEGMKKNNELREQRKDDAFKLTFAEFSRAREKRSEDMKEDQKDIRKAKAFASEKDPAVWPEVYKWVKAGLSDEEISKRMQGDFTKEVEGSDPTKPQTSATPPPPAPGSKAANPHSANVDAAAPMAVTPDQTEVPEGVPSANANPPAAAAMAPQGSNQTPVDAAAEQTQAMGIAQPTPAQPDPTMVQEEPEEAQTGTKLLTGLSGKKFGTKSQAAPGDQMIAGPEQTEQPQAAPQAPVNQQAPNQGGGINSFMRDTFGNGSGAQSRAEHFSIAKDSIASGLGISRQEVDDTFNGYTSPAVGDASDIRWTPAKAQAAPDKINTLDEAQIELDNAKASLDPERISVAERRVNSLIQSGKIKAEQTAAAQGLSAEGQYVNVFGQDSTGKRVWKGTVKVKENQNGQLVDFEGNEVDPQLAVPMDKREWTERDNLSNRAGKEVQEYRTALDNHVGLISGVGALDRTYRENPDALQAWASGGAKMAQDVANEIGAGINLLDKATDTEYSKEFAINTLEKQAQALQERVNKADNPISKLANSSALAETQKALLTYRLAATLGQTGRNLAETERKLIGQGFDASNYPQFRSKVGSLLQQSQGTIERQAETVKKQTEGFEGQYGYVPYEVQVETPKERLMNVDEKTDPDLFNGKQLLEGVPTLIETGAPSPATTRPAQTGEAPIGTKARNAKGEVLIKTQQGWVPAGQ